MHPLTRALRSLFLIGLCLGLPGAFPAEAASSSAKATSVEATSVETTSVERTLVEADNDPARCVGDAKLKVQALALRLAEAAAS